MGEGHDVRDGRTMAKKTEPQSPIVLLWTQLTLQRSVWKSYPEYVAVQCDRVGEVTV